MSEGDGKNAWRNMNDAQRIEFIGWILDGRDAPPMDAATWDAIEAASNSDKD